MQYGLIGEHLTHSYSREIHGKIADYAYELCELRPEELEPFFQKRDFLGINVTIPYKQSVISYLDSISETAQRIGAVNTIVNRGGKLHGDNTDFAGMKALVRYAGIEIAGRKVLILGTGGTSKTAHVVAESLGADSIVHVSRSRRGDAVTYAEAVQQHGDAHIIINTTPVGMYPNTVEVPIDLSHFAALEGVLDAVYHPLRSGLVLDGLSRGIPACGGLYMLVAQAVFASAAFFGKEPDLSLIDEIFRAIRLEKQNVVLIGMPSAGKTTVGSHLAKLTGKAFLDTDQIIVSHIGGTISEYFAAHGEEAFRKLEHEVISNAAKKDGCVIATGGGAVLDAENIRLLRQNGIIVFLNRSLEHLIVSAERPLSNSREALEKLYEKRYPLYAKAADLCVDANSSPEQIANAIREELGK